MFPVDNVKGDGNDVLVEGEGEGDNKVEDGEALGAGGFRKDFEGVSPR